MQVVLFLLGLFVVLFLLVRNAIMDCDNEGGDYSSSSPSSDSFHDFMRSHNQPKVSTSSSDDLHHEFEEYPIVYRDAQCDHKKHSQCDNHSFHSFGGSSFHE